MNPTLTTILSHLRSAGVLVALPVALSAAGCRETPAPETSTSATPEPTESAPATATPTAGGAPKGGECRADDDCQKGLHCELNFNGAEFSDDPGTCVDHVPIYEGRPLVIDGTPRVGELEAIAHPERHERIKEADLSGEVAMLERAAREEHASIAAFSRTICMLMTRAAPLSLIHKTQQALADEIEHTASTLRWLERAGGGSLRVGALPEATSSFVDDDEALLLDLIAGGCVGESLASDRLRRRSDKFGGTAYGRWLTSVADDEAAHAALAFETVNWLSSERPELAGKIRRVASEVLARASAEQRALVAPLFVACGWTA